MAKTTLNITGGVIALIFVSVVIFGYLLRPAVDWASDLRR